MKRLYWSLGAHLDDDCLARLVCNELGVRKRLIALRHLAGCWECRARHKKLERAALEVVEYRKYRDARLGPQLPPADESRDRFIRLVQRQLQQEPPKVGWSIRKVKEPTHRMPEIRTMLGAGAVFACAVVACVFVWLQDRAPDITSNALLVRAEHWDSPADKNETGVVLQTVTISAAKQRIRRAIYRDVENKRRPKPEMLPPSKEQLKGKLVDLAEIDWNAPLSATNYQNWHDRQRERQDRVARAGKHLLKLTTTVPSGSILQQSLTVRDTDFHPVERTITFRDNETDEIEIAEIDYRVLPWAMVEPDRFESLGPSASPLVLAGSAAPMPLTLPSRVTEAELDEAELGARLILNQLHADSDEQIEVKRTGQGIAVRGVVETNQRRQELQSQLRILPHTEVAILSIEDLRKQSTGEAQPVPISAGSASAQPSPLETYFVSHGRSMESLNGVSHRLLENAFIVTQESKALDELLGRFSPEKEGFTEIATATFTELLFAHREKLLRALEEEQQALDEAGASGTESSPHPGSEQQDESLAAGSERNLALCKELTFGNRAATRKAESILPALHASVVSLTARVRRLPNTSPTSNNDAPGRD